MIASVRIYSICVNNFCDLCDYNNTRSIFTINYKFYCWAFYKTCYLQRQQQQQHKMQSSPSIHRIDQHHFRDLLYKYLNNNTTTNNFNTDKVSDDNFLKYSVFEENSDYKKSITITSVTNEKNLNNESIRKMEIYRDRFGNAHKMVYSQKVHDYQCH